MGTTHHRAIRPPSDHCLEIHTPQSVCVCVGENETITSVHLKNEATQAGGRQVVGGAYTHSVGVDSVLVWKHFGLAVTHQVHLHPQYQLRAGSAVISQPARRWRHRVNPTSLANDTTVVTCRHCLSQGAAARCYNPDARFSNKAETRRSTGRGNILSQ